MESPLSKDAKSERNYVQNTDKVQNNREAKQVRPANFPFSFFAFPTRPDPQNPCRGRVAIPRPHLMPPCLLFLMPDTVVQKAMLVSPLSPQPRWVRTGSVK